MKQQTFREDFRSSLLVVVLAAILGIPLSGGLTLLAIPLAPMIAWLMAKNDQSLGRLLP